MKTIAEQISDLENTRAAKAARMSEVMTKSLSEGRSSDAAEGEEFDTLDSEIKTLDADLVRLKKLEKINIEKAAPVNPAANAAAGSAARETSSITVKSNAPKGTAFARYVQTLAASKGNLMQAAEMAKRYDSSTPEVSLVLRAAVAAGTTTDAAWAAPLVPYQQMTNEFVELLRPATIIGKLTGLRNVPFNIKMPTQTGGSTVNWVGQGAPKPVSQLSFGNLTLDFTKTAGIVVISEELARLSTPSAEAIIRQDLIDQSAQFTDVAFVDPSKAAVAGVSPASITNGAPSITASGTDADALRADIARLVGIFTSANLGAGGSAWIMTETQATRLSMMVNALGQQEFPGMTTQGGTLFGMPVVTSESVVQTQVVGPPAVTTAAIILVKQSEILLADDGGVTIDVSREASLQMDSAPTNPPTATTVMVSLWQMNLIGIRAERFINWVRRRPQAVAYISNANYS
jgi:HK97 family phage major capsid protein